MKRKDNEVLGLIKPITIKMINHFPPMTQLAITMIN